MDTKRPTRRHIIIKMPKIKDKEGILKAEREKQRVPYKRVPIGCQLIFQKKLCRLEGTGNKYSVMKSRDLQPDICEAKISFEIEGQIKCFPDKIKLKEFIIAKTLLQEKLKGLI